MRVLVVMPFPPLREGRAAARCAVALLQGLTARGIDCQALAPDSAAEPAKAPQDLPVELVRVESLSPWRVRRDRLANPAGGLAHGRFAQRLKALAADADIVHLIEVHAASTIRVFDRPTVVQLHCLTLRDREIRRLWKPEDRDSLELLRAERRACRRADWLLVNSREVADGLPGRVPRERIAIAPLALDPEHYAPSARLEQPVAGLIGTASWPPTANAVRRLLTRVWPLVLERRPDARLILAGAGMEAAAFGAGADLTGVEWRGPVPSASDFLRELGVLLYPLTAGSGAKVKVLEALALGVPVVSTREGAEGLGDLGGVVVEEDDVRLAEATVALLEDPDARRAAGARARASFIANHTPVPAAGPVVDLYERMVA
ncbi:MAG TPA: glycosyltransferase family 4 protein [Solirubrobacteraceae bacterium]|nr:glycosyltransferase family 4 protein [Solirubrobacteraceae bacterium]